MQTAVESQKPALPPIGYTWVEQPKRSFINVGHSIEARRDFEYPKLGEVVIDIADAIGEFIGCIKIEWISSDEQYRLTVWNFSIEVLKHCTDVFDALATPKMLRATVPMVCELLKSLGIKDNTPNAPDAATAVWSAA